MVIGGLGCGLGGNGKRAGIESRVVQRDTEAPIVKRPAVPTVVAERGGLRKRGCGAVIHATVYEERVGGCLIGVGSVVGQFAGLGGCIEVGALKTGLQIRSRRLGGG